MSGYQIEKNPSTISMERFLSNREREMINIRKQNTRATGIIWSKTSESALSVKK